MKLATIALKNFRSCLATTVALREHVTVLVGENDAGKSNIVDAVRASTPPTSGRRTWWFDQERDLTYSAGRDEAIEVGLTFTDLTPAEDALFLSSMVDGDGRLMHNTS